MKETLVYIILILIIMLNTSCEKPHVAENNNADLIKEQLHSQMDNARMHNILQRIDPELEGTLGSWLLHYENLSVQVITDENADRMRVIVPIAKLADLGEDELVRLMQANFDSVLDARYSIANGVLWSAFIHPLSILSDEEFVSGLAQAITAAATYGSTYSSGAMIFRGGDSSDKQREYYESIIEKGLAI